jgi:hypothetical protein
MHIETTLKFVPSLHEGLCIETTLKFVLGLHEGPHRVYPTAHLCALIVPALGDARDDPRTTVPASLKSLLHAVF